MKKSNLKRILRFALVLFVGLTLSLALHLYLIKQAKANQRVFAMGRIDFVNANPNENLTNIRNYAASINGINNAIYNSNERILVFMYEPKIIRAEEVLIKVKAHSKTEAIPYISSSEELNSGCPVNINNKSFLGKAMAFISPN
jgi:hypothetical protein